VSQSKGTSVPLQSALEVNRLAADGTSAPTSADAVACHHAAQPRVGMLLITPKRPEYPKLGEMGKVQFRGDALPPSPTDAQFGLGNRSRPGEQ
jgi:hypothetical protein